MKDIYKTKAQLIAELEALRKRAWKKDISDLAKKQKRIEASKRSLEKQVEKQIAELRHSNNALEQEISNRIEVESLLRENNELLETIFSNIHLLIAYLDTSFNFIRVNEAYARATGQPVAFFPGKNHFVLYPHKKNERIFRSVVASGEPYSVQEKPFVYPGNPEQTTYWDWMLQPLKIESGEVSGLILSLVDVTPRVEARKKTERYAEELEYQNKALSEFAFISSHDLQEPLRKILAFGSRLESNLSDKLNPQDLDYLQRMQNATQRMQTMLDGLLQYSRVTTNADSYSRVNLNQAASEAISNLQVRIEETGATVAIEPLPTLPADFHQMLQLFQNLIGNALKFHRKGVTPQINVSGKILTGKHEEGTDSKRCELRIEDNGIGFYRKHIERIFLPFERLLGRQGPEGAGMGLAICRKIVERHGGDITADSEPGRGSLFIVTLPVVLSKNGKSS
jgi:signal transduction histidine kinase